MKVYRINFKIWPKKINPIFPNDRYVCILDKNLKERKILESESLISYQGWTPTEVRVQQLSNKRLL